MADVQVTCINKTPRNNTHEGITHLGGTGGGGWKWTRQQVIDSIRNQSNTFYTQVGGKRADIRIVQGSNGPYLRTYSCPPRNLKYGILLPTLERLKTDFLNVKDLGYNDSSSR